MNLSQIEYFAKAAETCSFSRAAEELYVTQQAVSKAIAGLEGELGCRLFERGASGLELTGAGRRAYGRARDILYNVRHLADCSGDGARQILRLAVGSVIVGEGRHLTLDQVLSFAGCNPGYEVEMIEASSDDCLSMLADGATDVAVVAGRVLDSRFLVRLLHVERAVAFVARNHRLAGATSVSMSDLAAETFLIPYGSSASMEEIREAFFDAGVEVPDPDQFVFPNCSPGLLVGRVCRGEGVGFIGRDFAGFIEEARGTLLEVVGDPFVMRLSVAVRRPLVENSGADLLRRYLIGLFDAADRVTTPIPQRVSSLQGPSQVAP